MKTNNFPAPTCQHCRYCRHCRHFVPEGRRGGNCEQLGVLVRGGWKACSLALPAFAPSWEVIEGIAMWQGETLRVSEIASSRGWPVSESAHPCRARSRHDRVGISGNGPEIAAVGGTTENRISQSEVLAEELAVA
ncbi:MAG: hypothetical protein EBE86_008180 [Hormoscilla sp. GUM202]|nr:hypothetical protein [Hormoscilla sp. GUM202]